MRDGRMGGKNEREGEGEGAGLAGLPPSTTKDDRSAEEDPGPRPDQQLTANLLLNHIHSI